MATEVGVKAMPLNLALMGSPEAKEAAAAGLLPAHMFMDEVEVLHSSGESMSQELQFWM